MGLGRVEGGEGWRDQGAGGALKCARANVQPEQQVKFAMGRGRRARDVTPQDEQRNNVS